VIILLFLLDFAIIFEEAAADDMVGDGVVDGRVRWWVTVDGGRGVCRAEAHAWLGSSLRGRIQPSLGHLSLVWIFGSCEAWMVLVTSRVILCRGGGRERQLAQ
jgi:hypothetical protein